MNNVVNIGDHRFTRKRDSWLSKDACKHLNKTFDANGDIITCDDCSMQLSPVWVIHQLIDSYNREMDRLDARERVLREQTGKDLHLIAAKTVEAVWRRKSVVPGCPHCHRGILPEDRLGSMQVSRAIELSRRRADLARSS